MNTSGGAGNVRGILSELQTNVARKKNDIAALDNKIQERQISLNQLIQPKLQKLAEEKEEMERQLIEEMEEKIQDMKVEVKSIGESLEAMEDKIQDMKVEGIENIRYIHLHILELLKKNFVDIIVRLTSRIFFCSDNSS